MEISLQNYEFGKESDLAGMPLTDSISDFVDKLPHDLTSVLNKISLANGGVWLVGGAVRDAALGIYPNDIDIATDLEPARLLTIFPNAIETGIAFGTITIRSGEYHFQTTTLRSEENYSDNRRPNSVNWETSLKSDLERRDFTINAMAIDVARRILYDPHNGLIDLDNKIIRCVGIPMQRISEDALRMLRAYRFLGHRGDKVWQLESQLKTAIKNNSFLMKDLARERIWQELKKILKSNVACEIIEQMLENDILDHIFDCQIDNKSHLKNALNDSKLLDYISLLVVILNNMPKKDIIQICQSLKLPNKDLRIIRKMLDYQGRLPSIDKPELRLFRHLLSERYMQQLQYQLIISKNLLTNTDGIDYLQVIAIIDEIQKLKPLKKDHQIIDGHWLMAATNLPKGERLGRLKEWMYRLQIEHDLSTIHEVSELLCKIQWLDEDFHSWPRLSLI